MGEGSAPDLSSGEANTSVTEILAAMDRGDQSAAERLLPLVYDELRRLARARMAQEPSGHTLQPTALVHEAYLRLLGSENAGSSAFKNRAHFFGAAAEAMRRILVERARQKQALKHGGGRQREQAGELPADDAPDPESIDLVALDDALQKLSAVDQRLREVVMLRFFAGLTVEQTAEAMNMGERTIKRDWDFARTWLHREMSGAASPREGAGSAQDAAG